MRRRKFFKRNLPAKRDWLEPPTFEEYVAARKVVLYVVDELRREQFNGQLNVASDEMIARIVHRSCPHFQPKV